MYRYSRIISFLITLAVIGYCHIAAAADVPVWCPDTSHVYPSSDTVYARIQACVQARNAGNPNTITDFVCPSGEFFDADGQPLTRETLAYNIAVNLVFNQIDTAIVPYMKQLQQSREKNPAIWIKNTNTCLNGDTDPAQSIAWVYQHVCDFGVIESLVNNNSAHDVIIRTTMTYPQQLCTVIASKKISAWKNLRDILMSDSIVKSNQNSTEAFADGITGAYRSILNKFHQYQKILGRAVSKMTNYIVNPVK